MGPRSGTRKLHAAILVAACLLAPTTLDARSKIDTVSLDNGDRITCEIKELNRGILNIKTDYITGTVSIEWIHVRGITSSQLFELELEDGTRLFGAIAAAAEAQQMAVTTGTSITAVDYHQVVRISQIDENFWDRLKGSLDVGVSAKAANNERGYNLSASADYRTPKYRLSSTLNSSLSDRDDTAKTTRNDLGFSSSRPVGGTWFVGSNAKFETNEELGLDLRATLSGGAGQYLIQSNRTLLSWLTGLAGNREWYADAEEYTDNIEALLQLQYQLFLFGNKETDIATTLSVYPNISTWGRVRSSLDAKLKHEFVKDFYFSFSLLVDYDSEPPTESERFDWNLSSSLGYSF